MTVSYTHLDVYKRQIWTRVSDNPEDDKAWNAAHYGGRKSIDITADDVQVRATFFCDLIDTFTRASLR